MPSFIKHALIYLAAAAVCFGLMYLFMFLFFAVQKTMEKTKSTVVFNLLLPVNDLMQFLFLFFQWMRFLILPMMFFGWNDHIITWYSALVMIGMFVFCTIGAGEFWVTNYDTFDIRWYGIALQFPVSFYILNWPVYLFVRSLFATQYGLDGWALYVCVFFLIALNIFLIVYYSIQFYRFYKMEH